MNVGTDPREEKGDRGQRESDSGTCGEGCHDCCQSVNIVYMCMCMGECMIASLGCYNINYYDHYCYNPQVGGMCVRGGTGREN